MEWSKETVVRLIKLYRLREIMWDTKNLNHSNQSLRSRAWTEIGVEMGFTAEECKKKMGSLLAQFRKERKRVMESRGTGKGAEEIYIPSWFAYKSFRFLPEKEATWQSRSTIPDQTEQQGLLSDDSLGSDSEIHFPHSSDQQINKTSKNQRLPSSGPPNKRIKSMKDERLDKGSANFQQDSPSQENIVFGTFVALKLSKLTPDLQNSLQRDFSVLLFNAVSGHYQPLSQSQYLQNLPAHPIISSPDLICNPDPTIYSSAPGPSTRLSVSTNTSPRSSHSDHDDVV